MNEKASEPFAEPTKLPENILEILNGFVMGFDKTIGLRYTSAKIDELHGIVPVGEHLQQPYGLVHGGVYASIAESMASSGAAMTARMRGQSVVGLENTTSFLRAIREGSIHGVAKALVRGRKFHVWEVQLFGDNGKLAATGRVRLACLEPGSRVAGEEPQVRSLKS
jgi:1,4-dihydroxy-2-naphthoyl-CoA hydrolase